eukprot:Plantae.Rhodophyta-Hildenbrandia_rubra.ctg10812.p1 GENE.Plantae.Rhodophyta-Hildenbrandia_rubra.ctg10812~~Plantae.Rhodophyta-Hildenbrandia_rubra.ctg10812.p1  ORF type:complete len:273 (+),score=81.14 Plantae.Rhodophyta-Hildenbrandia_rubra.ctg10812:41-859(+)
MGGDEMGSVVGEFRSYVEGRIGGDDGNIGVGRLEEEERKWLDDACLSRFLIARNNNMNKAWDMLYSCMKWRREFKVASLIRGEGDNDVLVKREGESGKIVVMRGGRNGEAVVLMRPGFENSKDAKGNVKFLVWSLERACAIGDRWIVIVDYNGYSWSNAPSMAVARETVRILQTCYPERLKKAILVEPPGLFWMGWKVLKHFVDPITRDKLRFVKEGEMKEDREIREDILDTRLIPVQYGGHVEWEWNCESYFAESIRPDYLNQSSYANGVQ